MTACRLLLPFTVLVWCSAVVPDRVEAQEIDVENRQSAVQDRQADGSGTSSSSAVDSKAPSRERSGPAADVAADAGALANAAANPAAPLTQIQLRNIFAPKIPGTDGSANLLEVQPVIPVGPFTWFRELQLVRFTLPFVTLPGPVDERGIGDLSVFDLVSVKTGWGRWGAGPYLVFPTAASEALGAGKYQAGPAFGAFFTTNRLTAGAILQNPISFAGDPDRDDVNQLIVAPTLTVTFEGGWFVGLSDFNWTFDWENGGAASIPIGVQAGKIVRLGRQPFTLALEAGRMAARPASIPDPGWILGVEFSPLFNWHLGPKKKIRLRSGSGG